MHILIGKALKHVYTLKESLILCLHVHIVLSLEYIVKQNTMFKRFTIDTLWIYLPTREQTLTSLNFKEIWN